MKEVEAMSKALSVMLDAVSEIAGLCYAAGAAAPYPAQEHDRGVLLAAGVPGMARRAVDEVRAIMKEVQQ